jgi:hypothetical protein
MMMFIFEWILFYIFIILTMCIDNIFWISASPEYSQYKKYSFYNKIKYIVNFRIKSVLTNWRDIIPAVITSFILALLI